MLDAWLAVKILGLHWVADFVMQTDAVAKAKSSSNLALTKHILIYAAPFALLFGWKYAVVNAAAHWVTDWASSRMTTKLYLAGDRHNFFVVIGLDQLAHAAVLLKTAEVML